jgi:hypothetical protein
MNGEDDDGLIGHGPSPAPRAGRPQPARVIGARPPDRSQKRPFRPGAVVRQRPAVLIAIWPALLPAGESAHRPGWIAPCPDCGHMVGG